MNIQIYKYKNQIDTGSLDVCYANTQPVVNCPKSNGNNKQTATSNIHIKMLIPESLALHFHYANGCRKGTQANVGGMNS